MLKLIRMDRAGARHTPWLAKSQDGSQLHAVRTVVLIALVSEKALGFTDFQLFLMPGGRDGSLQ